MCVQKKVYKIGRALLLATAGLMVAGMIAAQLDAQSFIVSQNGKSVGSASLKVSKAAAGFSVSSGTKIDMPGLKYQFSEIGALDSAYRLNNVQLDGTVNGTSVTINTARQAQSSAGQQYVMKISANAKVTSTPLAYHPRAVFFPDFDPGALQALLNVGALHNNADIWALVPKQTGSVEPVRIETNADMQGTLDGKPVTVHHLTTTYQASKLEIFSGQANELLQAEWRTEGFAIVRQGFKLTPPDHPGAPPQQPAQPQGQQPQGQAPTAQPAQPQIQQQ